MFTKYYTTLCHHHFCYILCIQYFLYQDFIWVIDLVVRETNLKCFDADIWSCYNNFMIPIIQYIEFRFIFEHFYPKVIFIK